MPGHVKVSGAWKALDGIHVKVSGTWKAVQVGYVKVSGAWKEFYAAIAVTVSGHTILSDQLDPADAYARLKIDNDGRTYESEDTGSPSWSQIDSATDWIRPTSEAPADYEVRYTSLTGDALTSGTAAEDAWHALSGGDFILVQSTTIIPGDRSSTFAIEIRKGSGAVLDSASYTLTADVGT